jgi:Protein of unknown function (DUF3644)
VPTRMRGKALEPWEAALVKAMLAKRMNDQDILCYFTRPTRSVNHRCIGEIRNRKKHADVKPAAQEELDAFVSSWPAVDSQTGLHMRGDELVIKAREAMIAGVSTFNGMGLYFRAELFIVTAIISWTYLHLAYFRRQGIDCRYWENGTRQIMRTKHGADKYWELSYCLKRNECPLSKPEKENLEFLLELRNEIEHRSTERIDEIVSEKLQACCINFNDQIKTLFGHQYGLEKRLPIALQFVTFGADQRAILRRASALPAHISSMMDGFNRRLTDEERSDPRFAHTVAFVQRISNKSGTADQVINFEKGSPDETTSDGRIFIQQVSKKQYRPSSIVKIMQRRGFRKFNTHYHSKLWKTLKARDEHGKYGDWTDGKQWF